MPSPAQWLHFFLMMRPSPPQVGQVVRVCMVPSMVCWLRTTEPVPLHVGHVSEPLPSSAPVPWQLLAGDVLFQFEFLLYARGYLLEGEFHLDAQVRAPETALLLCASAEASEALRNRPRVRRRCRPNIEKMSSMLIPSPNPPNGPPFPAAPPSPACPNWS